MNVSLLHENSFENESANSLGLEKYQFCKLAEEISALASDSNIRINPYYDKNLPTFSKLEAAGRVNVLKELKLLKELCEGAVGDSISLEEGRKFAWFAMRRLGLRPPSDLFDKIKDTDIIEIHNRERQVFRCFSYFRVCSYSLEELSSKPWNELYHRNPILEEQIMRAARETAQSQEITFPNIREHLVEESSSPFRYQGRYSMQLIAPLTSDSGQKDHLLAAVQIQLVNMRTPLEQEQLLREYKNKNE